MLYFTKLNKLSSLIVQSLTFTFKENFSKEGYILALDDFSKLGELLEKCKTFQPKEYNSNTSKMIKIVSKYIDKTEYRFNYKALFILIALLILIIL